MKSQAPSANKKEYGDRSAYPPRVVRTHAALLSSLFLPPPLEARMSSVAFSALARARSDPPASASSAGSPRTALDIKPTPQIPTCSGVETARLSV